MTSGSDDLEEQLRQNLKLRHDLGALAAKAKDDSANEDSGNSLSSTAEGAGAASDDLQKLRLELKLRRAMDVTAASKADAEYRRDGPRAPGSSVTRVINTAWIAVGCASLALAALIAVWLTYGWPLR